MREDFLKVKELIDSKREISKRYAEYDRVYPYTTENINGYMHDVSGKTVLTVAGSGDHYLNLITKGAKRVDCFDINKPALDYSKLKKATVKALSKRQFYEFLTNDSQKYFNQINRYLDMDSGVFWSYYVKYVTDNTGIQDSFLFYPRVGGSDYLRRNEYLTNEGYELLKERIMDKTEIYYWGDIHELVPRLDKYDSIYLSNICGSQADKKKFRDLVLSLRDNNLNDDGELYYGYFYDTWDKDVDYYKEEIEDTTVIEIDGVYPKTVDKVLKLKKKN